VPEPVSSPGRRTTRKGDDPLVFHDRKRLVAAVTGLVALLVLAVFPAGSSSAKPSISDVKKRVDTLYHQAEQAQERLNDVQVELRDLNKDLSVLRADENRSAERLSGARADVESSVVRQYVGDGVSAVGHVIVSDDPRAFLGQLSTMSTFNALQDGLYADYATELKALELRKRATGRRAADVAKAQQKLVAEQEKVDAALTEAKTVLADLEAAERAKLLAAAAAGGPIDLPSNIPASGRAAIAIKYAMAQVGDRYVYGAAGPNSFDCSGLMMMAWAQAGVGLPHSSRSQYGSGPHVSRDALQPGDLVFYYSPISHVGMYIGNGLIVHAANPSAGVRVSGVFSMPYAGAVRLG
jgi:peptidoglycan DL-endopeptidase CwlO